MLDLDFGQVEQARFRQIVKHAETAELVWPCDVECSLMRRSPFFFSILADEILQLILPRQIA